MPILSKPSDLLHCTVYKTLSPPLLLDPPQNPLRQGGGDVIKNLILQLRKLRLGDVTELLKFFPHQSPWQNSVVVKTLATLTWVCQLCDLETGFLTLLNLTLPISEMGKIKAICQVIMGVKMNNEENLVQ